MNGRLGKVKCGKGREGGGGRVKGWKECRVSEGGG